MATTVDKGKIKGRERGTLLPRAIRARKQRLTPVANTPTKGTLKQEDVQALQTKFGAPIDAATPGGTIVLLFDKTAGILTVANTLAKDAPLFTSNCRRWS